MDISLFRTQLTGLNKRLRKEARNHPEAWSRMLVLSAIDRMNGEATPSKIGEAENLRSSNLAALLRELSSSGLIVRSQDDSDRRRVRISLSEQGKAVLEESRQLRDQWLAKATQACLTSNETEMLVAAGYLMERLEKFVQ